MGTTLCYRTGRIPVVDVMGDATREKFETFVACSPTRRGTIVKKLGWACIINDD